MPITRSAIKKLKQDKRRRLENVLVMEKTRKTIKKFRKNPSVKTLPDVFSAIDTNVKKHIFHPNKASRLKSRLSKLLIKSPGTHKPNTTKTRKATSKKTP